MSVSKEAKVDMPGLGTGVYSHKMAAHLLGVRTARVKRWAEGYNYWSGGILREAPPILQREQYYEGVLSFKDLIELLWVKSYAEAGIRMHNIKLSAERLSVSLSTPYPFTQLKLKQDGKDLVIASLEGLESASKGQKAFKFGEKYTRNVEFKGLDALKWWPMGKACGVLVDPRFSFGAPIIEKVGIRTETLYLMVLAEEGDEELVADWYDVPKSAVRSAVEFEQWQRKNLAA